MKKKDDVILVKDYWKYTIPLLVNQLGWGGGVTMYSVIMGHLGSDAVAANSIASTVRMMVASFCWGVSSAVGIVIGGLLGKGELDDAKRLGGKYVRLSILIGIASGIIFAFWIKAPVLVVAFILTLDEFVKLPFVYKHYMKYQWVKNITRD